MISYLIQIYLQICLTSFPSALPTPCPVCHLLFASSCNGLLTHRLVSALSILQSILSRDTKNVFLKFPWINFFKLDHIVSPLKTLLSKHSNKTWAPLTTTHSVSCPCLSLHQLVSQPHMCYSSSHSWVFFLSTSSQGGRGLCICSSSWLRKLCIYLLNYICKDLSLNVTSPEVFQDHSI